MRSVALTLEAAILLVAVGVALAFTITALYWGLSAQTPPHYSKSCADALIALLIASTRNVTTMSELREAVQASATRLQKLGCSLYYVKAVVYKYSGDKGWERVDSITLGDSRLSNSLYPRIVTMIYVPIDEGTGFTLARVDVSVIAFQGG